MKTPKSHTLHAAPASAPAHVALSFSADCTILEAAPGVADALPRFEITAYTGGKMTPETTPPIKYRIVVDLANLDISNQTIPAIKDHNQTLIVGHTDSVSHDGRTLSATGVISGTSPVAREVAGNGKNGFPWKISIGADVGNLEFVPQNSTVQVNGQRVAGPVYVARSGVLQDVSFLTRGADASTSARIAAEHAAERPHMTFEKWLEGKGFTLAACSDQQKQYLEAQFEAEQKEPDPDSGTDSETVAVEAGAGNDDPVTLQRKHLAADRQRMAAFATIENKYASKVPSETLHTLTASAISGGWDVNKYELELVRKSRPEAQGGTNSPAQRGSKFKLSAAAMTAALSLTAGVSEKSVAAQIPAADREQVMNEANASGMRGYSLHALMDHVIHEAGGHYAGSRKSNEYIRAAFAADRQLQAAHSLEADGFSTMGLGSILSNVANKGLIASYTAVEVVWPNIAAVRNHSDFKIHTRYRLDSTGAFRKIGADGELKNVGLDAASYTNQLATYGAIIALTRQMMINDDLGAFMEIPNLLGRMAALRLEEAVFVLLLANVSGPFFATGNSNLISGAGSAFGIDALQSAESTFRKFVDSNGKPVLVSPNRVVVGTALATLASQLYRDTTLIATGVGSTAKVVVNGNPYVGKYQPYVSPYLDNTAIRDQDGRPISGQSATLWLMLADPAVRAAIGVAFLNGQKTPTIESSQTDFDTLGMQWRAFHDFGVGMEETTAAVGIVGA